MRRAWALCASVLAIAGGAAGGDVVLAQFVAPWCAACAEGSPVRAAWGDATSGGAVGSATYDVASPEGAVLAGRLGVASLPAVWAFELRGDGEAVAWALRYKGGLANATAIAAFAECAALRRCGTAATFFPDVFPDGARAGLPEALRAAQAALRGTAVVRTAEHGEASCAVRIEGGAGDACVPAEALPQPVTRNGVEDLVYDHAMPHYVGELTAANPWRAAFLDHPEYLRLVAVLPPALPAAAAAAWEAALQRSYPRVKAAWISAAAPAARAHFGVPPTRAPALLIEDPTAVDGPGRWVWDSGPADAPPQLGDTALKAAAALTGAAAPAPPAPTYEDVAAFLAQVGLGHAEELPRTETADEVFAAAHPGGRVLTHGVTYATFEDDVYGAEADVVVYVYGALHNDPAVAPPRALAKLAHRLPAVKVCHFNAMRNDVPKGRGLSVGPLPAVWFYPAAAAPQRRPPPTHYLGPRPVTADGLAGFIAAQVAPRVLEEKAPLPPGGFLDPPDGHAPDEGDPVETLLYRFYHDVTAPRWYFNGRSWAVAAPVLGVVAPAVLLAAGLVGVALWNRAAGVYYRRRCAALLSAYQPYLTAEELARHLAERRGHEREYYEQLCKRHHARPNAAKVKTS